jgi:hypothetical protein
MKLTWSGMACLLAAFALVGCSKNEPVMLGIRVAGTRSQCPAGRE